MSKKKTKPSKAPKAAKANKAPKVAKEPKAKPEKKAKAASKLDIVIELLKRPEGATIEDMVKATGWQKHTVRSAVSAAIGKKRGYKVVNEKSENGVRTYKIVDTEQ